MAVKENDLKNRSIVCTEYQPELCSCRMADADYARFKENKRKLAIKIGAIKLKFEKDNQLSSIKAYEALEEKCQISVSTFKYALKGDKRYTANRRFLYKFVVGLKLSLEEANELFELENGRLNESCLEDLICMCALRDNDDIYEFIEEFEDKTGSKISLRERKTDRINR